MQITLLYEQLILHEQLRLLRCLDTLHNRFYLQIPEGQSLAGYPAQIA